MRIKLTNTAAVKVYLATLILYFWVLVLGVVDHILLSENILMRVVSPSVMVIASFFLFALLLVSKLPSFNKLANFQRLYTVLGLILFGYLQLTILNQIQIPAVLSQLSPFALPLIAIMLLGFLYALSIRDRVEFADLKIDGKSNITLMVIVISGASIWFALSMQSVTLNTQRANEKINLVSKMIDARVDEQVKALKRIASRLETQKQEASFDLVATDINLYVRDFDVIEGIAILDEQQNVKISSNFASEFIAKGGLKDTDTKRWLQTEVADYLIRIHRPSLSTSQPIVMILLPIVTNRSESFELLALLDMYDFVNPTFLAHLQEFTTFEFIPPNFWFPMQHTPIKLDADTLNNYPVFATVEKTSTATGNKHTFISLLTDANPVTTASRLHQIVLWLTTAFAAIFIFAADTRWHLQLKSLRLKSFAKYDQLTGFLRREVLSREVKKYSKTHNNIAHSVIFVDLDNFHSFNDGLGAKFGDLILTESAGRIRKAATNGKLFGRFANDQFVVYYPHNDTDVLEAEAEAIRSIIARKFLIDDMRLYLTASIGVAVAKHHDEELESLIQHACIAMDKAKDDSGNCHRFYQAEMHLKHKEMVRLRSEIQHALNRDKFEVFYQPIYCASLHTIVSVECLARWQRNGDPISPAVFIPIAETTGQIVQLGRAIFKKVLTDIKNNPVLKNITVAINISPHQLKQDGFVDRVLNHVSQSGIQHHNLILELTESVMAQATHTEQILKELRDHNFHVAIDDFGTGFSSLSYLANQPADIVKIDRAFTIGVEQQGKQRNLLVKMIEMCKQLDKTVVVEGVETKQQVELFRELGVDRLQGFYFSKPVPLAQFLKLLK